MLEPCSLLITVTMTLKVVDFITRHNEFLYGIYILIVFYDRNENIIIQNVWESCNIERYKYTITAYIIKI